MYATTRYTPSRTRKGTKNSEKMSPRSHKEGNLNQIRSHPDLIRKMSPRSHQKGNLNQIRDIVLLRETFVDDSRGLCGVTKR